MSQAGGTSDGPGVLFIDHSDNLIRERYLPEQICNIDKNELFCWRMPKWTYILKETKTITERKKQVRL